MDITGSGLIGMKICGLQFEVLWQNYQYYAFLDGEEIARANNSRNLKKKLHHKIAYWDWWNKKQLQLFL